MSRPRAHVAAALVALGIGLGGRIASAGDDSCAQIRDCINSCPSCTAECMAEGSPLAQRQMVDLADCQQLKCPDRSAQCLSENCGISYSACGGTSAYGQEIWMKRTPRRFRAWGVEYYRGVGSYDWTGFMVVLGYGVSNVHLFTEIGGAGFSGARDDGTVEGKMMRTIFQVARATWIGDHFFYRYGGGLGVGFIYDVEETVADETDELDPGLLFPMCLSAGAAVANLGNLLLSFDLLAGYNLGGGEIGSFHQLEGRVGAAWQW